MLWGEIAELPADDVREVTLHEMTQRVSAMLTPKYQARRALKSQQELAQEVQRDAKATPLRP